MLNIVPTLILACKLNNLLKLAIFNLRLYKNKKVKGGTLVWISNK